MRELLQGLDNARMLEPAQSVSWGGFSITLTALFGLSTLVQWSRDWDYFVNLRYYGVPFFCWHTAVPLASHPNHNFFVASLRYFSCGSFGCVFDPIGAAAVCVVCVHFGSGCEEKARSTRAPHAWQRGERREDQARWGRGEPAARRGQIFSGQARMLRLCSGGGASSVCLFSKVKVDGRTDARMPRGACTVRASRIIWLHSFTETTRRRRE